MNSRGIRYYSMGDASGYGIAGVAYVRGLVNAGVKVEWVRLHWARDPQSGRPLAFGQDFPLLRASGNSGNGNFADLRALVERTSQPVNHDIVIVHSVPDYWPNLFEHETGTRNIGSTVWETDRPPLYWLPLLNLADRILVPCQMNQQDFVRAGVRPSVHVVPHIRRHSADVYSIADLDRARTRLGIPTDHRVFYSINTWDPRKALPDLIDAYARAFRAEDKVTLQIKTGKIGFGDGPGYAQIPTADLFAEVTRTIAARTHRPLPHICLIDGELDDRGVGLLHQLGDCYVSLSHGEGWGLGAFDAATFGNPVIMTAWSAPLDYLAVANQNWPGAIPVRMVGVPIYPPYEPSYFSSQRWAQPDLDAAAALMRRFLEDGDEMRAAASAIRIDICNRFAEPVVTHDLLKAIHV